MTSHFTGKYIQNHGVTENARRIPESEITLAERIPGGFRTAAFVANPVLHPVRGYNAGFDEYTMVNETVEVTDAALVWLETNLNYPFFLWLHYLDPHGPYQPPQHLRSKFVGDDFYDASKRVAIEYDPIVGQHKDYVLGAVPEYQRLGDHDEVDYYIAQYDAEIFWVDTQVGRLLEFLENSRLRDRVVMVLTSDHGESLGENNYFFEHGMLVNEGSIRIPFIVAGPGIPQRRVDALAQNTDTLPTLLRELGLSELDGIDGVDLHDLIHGRKSEARDFVYSCTPYPEYTTFFEAYRTKSGKLVRSWDGSYSYFDISSDPQELENRVHEFSKSMLTEWSAVLSGFGRRDGSTEAPSLPEDVTKSLRAIGYLN